MRYEYKAKFPIECNGFRYQPGDVVLTIDTEVPSHQIVGTINVCECVEIDSAPPAIKLPEPPVTKLTESVETKNTEVIEPPKTVVIDISGYPGLDRKLAEPLVTAGYLDSDSIDTAIDGGLDLIDLKGIGAASKGKILKWLSELGNPTVEDESDSDSGE